jgi:hypothetical protein
VAGDQSVIAGDGLTSPFQSRPYLGRMGRGSVVERQFAETGGKSIHLSPGLYRPV